MKKTLYSLAPLRNVLRGANRLYLEFLSALDDSSAGAARLQHLTKHGDAHNIGCLACIVNVNSTRAGGLCDLNLDKDRRGF